MLLLCRFVNFRDKFLKGKDEKSLKIRVISAFLVLVLVFVLLPLPVQTSALAVTVPEIEEQIRTYYKRSLSASGRKNFNGYCGTLVGWQLYYLGIETKAVARHGKDHFDAYEDETHSSGGYGVETYSAADKYTLRTALSAITKDGTENAYNLMVGFQKTSTSAGSIYGHALVVHAIIDGRVYFVECYDAYIGGKTFEEGQAVSCTIEEFCAYYERWTVFEGIAYFGIKTYADLCKAYPCHMEAMVLKDTLIYDEPGDDGVNQPQADRSAVSGQWLEITGLYKTPHGKFWYKVNTSGKAGFVEAEELLPKEISVTDIAMTKLKVPTNIRKGKSFVVEGTVSAGLTQMNSVTVTAGAGDVLYVGTGKASGGSVKLSTSSINNKLLFRKMPIGSYDLKIEAEVTNYVVENGEAVAKTETVTLYQSQFQVVSSIDQYCTVKFNGNGGVPLIDQTVVEKQLAVGELPTAMRSGYAFAGWALDKEGTKPVDANTVFTASTTLYAQWVTGHTGEGGWHHTENGSHYCDGETAAEGWFEFEGLYFYQYPDGTLATGWAWIDNCLRYFNSAGALVTQLEGEDGRVYCMNEEDGLLGWSIQPEEETQ